MAREDHDDLRNRSDEYTAELWKRAEGPSAGQRNRLIATDSANRSRPHGNWRAGQRRTK
jgi:hypothetical protein